MTIFFHPESDCLWAEAYPSRDYHQDQVVQDYPLEYLRAGAVISTALGAPSIVLPSFDFETFSAVGYSVVPQPPSASGEWTPPYKVVGVGSQGKGGLPVVGTAVYAEHPSTEVLSLQYDLKDGKGPRLWVPGSPTPFDLLQHIAQGGLMEAWNVTFEWYIWNLICVPRFGWPVLPLSQCRCAMAKSRRFSLPGSLDGAAAVLDTPRKDPDGKRLLQKLSRPHTPTQKRPDYRWTPATAWEDFVGLYRYNGQDIVAEDYASAHIPDLTPAELKVWLMDQTINARGVQVDVEALDAALAILSQAEAVYTQELVEITGGKVNSVSEVARYLDWLRENGVHLPDLQAETVSEALEGPLPLQCKKALFIRSALGSANVKKLRKLKLQVSRDGRLRNQYMYCGADRTGRWSSAAADDDASNSQLQNITAKGPDMARCESCGKLFSFNSGSECCPRCGGWMCKAEGEWSIEGVEQAIEDIKTRSFDHVRKCWGGPIALLCGCLRGMFVARPGHRYICCDFSAIEAVVAACLSRCQWRIEVFSTHGKIYEASVSQASGVPLKEILEHKKKHGTHHPLRKRGKVRELAASYGGWIQAWKNFGADEYFENDEAIKKDVLSWRAESPEIVEMWGGQYVWCGPGKWDYRPELFGLEGCAIQAIQNPGKCFSHYDITYGVSDDILFCRLPSGRLLHYHRPRLVEGDDRLGRGPVWKVTFEGYNSNSKKGPIGWTRIETYGGMLFENVVQAVSRDLQAEALLRCEEAGYPIVMHTHDEGCAEVPEGFGTVDEMVALMVRRPEWASWWPIRAAGWEHKRYQKD